MQPKFTFVITPTAAAATQLSQLLQRDDDRGATSKLRRTSHTLVTPSTYAPTEITVNEPGEKSSSQTISFTCTADPAEYLVGIRALTDNVFRTPARFILALFKTWLKKKFPDISDALLAAITDNHCRISEVTGTYYFQFNSATRVFEVFDMLHAHASIVLDSGEPYPGIKATAKAPTPRVQSDTEDRQAFSIDLSHMPNREEFGSVRVSLMREPLLLPKSINTADPTTRETLRAKARRLLRFEVQVDVGKTLHFGENLNFKLPADLRDWTKEKFPRDPFEIIWEALRYALWLNIPLATDEAEVSREGLRFGAPDVLEAYFLGENLKLNTWIAGDVDDHKKFRKHLIEKAHVDILVPWEIAKLNKSAVLGPILSYENRFQPGSDPNFADHTLSRHNVDTHIRALIAKLPTDVVPEESSVDDPGADAET